MKQTMEAKKPKVDPETQPESKPIKASTSGFRKRSCTVIPEAMRNGNKAKSKNMLSGVKRKRRNCTLESEPEEDINEALDLENPKVLVRLTSQRIISKDFAL